MSAIHTKSTKNRIYISQEDNFYMNDSINDVEKVHSLILNNTNSKSVIMNINH